MFLSLKVIGFLQIQLPSSVCLQQFSHFYAVILQGALLHPSNGLQPV
jgi:hypothetical protein